MYVVNLCALVDGIRTSGASGNLKGVRGPFLFRGGVKIKKPHSVVLVKMWYTSASWCDVESNRTGWRNMV